jgi:hypothetical protein
VCDKLRKVGFQHRVQEVVCDIIGPARDAHSAVVSEVKDVHVAWLHASWQQIDHCTAQRINVKNGEAASRETTGACGYQRQDTAGRRDVDASVL